MSNKQALRELQQRLAQRMQAAREQPQTASWLAVEAGGAPLLFPLRQSSEIFTPVPLKPVPYAKPWLLGVANLRGGLHTVVDLAAFLGLREAGAAPRGEGARLVTVNPDLNINCALLVDKLLGLRGDEQLQPLEGGASDTGSRPKFAGGLWRDGEGRRWQALDLEALARHEQFLRIVA
ncbi:chemotaxis protein CheW [Roseateles sp. DAIF2]|uniref:chemotaxis protein CheW n=1 Tax=Roseateles sp. DAIF2 TaxID=2714952 RepID=UPI0018A2E681|nr:chemotaxis protein CheW [Roseateles sp. DAIF2]QPF72634.1 chemotaxis protein CheW [Roseateles sp. DAIF2]